MAFFQRCYRIVKQAQRLLMQFTYLCRSMSRRTGEQELDFDGHAAGKILAALLGFLTSLLQLLSTRLDTFERDLRHPDHQRCGFIPNSGNLVAW
jgi:hypothetical protein